VNSNCSRKVKLVIKNTDSAVSTPSPSGKVFPSNYLLGAAKAPNELSANDPPDGPSSGWDKEQISAIVMNRIEQWSCKCILLNSFKNFESSDLITPPAETIPRISTRHWQLTPSVLKTFGVNVILTRLIVWHVRTLLHFRRTIARTPQNPHFPTSLAPGSKCRRAKSIIKCLSKKGVYLHL